jgi:hypothetical protein
MRLCWLCFHATPNLRYTMHDLHLHAVGCQLLRNVSVPCGRLGLHVCEHASPQDGYAVLYVGLWDGVGGVRLLGYYIRVFGAQYTMHA